MIYPVCKLNEIKFYYKLVNKQQPQYFNSFTHETNSAIHSHNTRRRNELHIPKTKHDFAKTNLRYRILQTINELPDTVASKVYTHSINGVTNYVKQYFIAAYKIECTIGNCYMYANTRYHNQLKPSPKDVFVCTYIIHVYIFFNKLANLFVEKCIRPL